jgi:hypothetical protein
MRYRFVACLNRMLYGRAIIIDTKTAALTFGRRAINSVRSLERHGRRLRLVRPSGIDTEASTRGGSCRGLNDPCPS